MDHIAYCDGKAHELERLLQGEKSMLIRGAAGRKLPYGRVDVGDRVYLLNNDGRGEIRAQGVVSRVYHSPRLTPEESAMLIEENQRELGLTEEQRKRWTGKRFLCLVDLKDVHEVEPFTYVREKSMDDWIVITGTVHLIHGNAK